MIPLALRRGRRDVRATVSPVGASLRRLAVDDTELVRNTLAEHPPLSAGVILVPWPNRVDGASWSLDGVPQRLEVTEPEFGHALHGLLADRRYTVAARAEHSVVLAAPISEPPGYPFRLDTSVAYTLTPSGVRVVHRIANRGRRRAPVAIGAHPYLRLGDRRLADLVFTTSARQALRLDERHVPIGSFPTEATEYDLSVGRRVRDLPRHACYTGLAFTARGVEHRLADPADGSAVVLEADRAFAWLQTYVVDEFPGAGPGDPALAVEPMTAPPDALNSGEGLRWLGPGDMWEARWGIHFEDSPAG